MERDSELMRESGRTLLSESEMAVAEQLVQLSDEDDVSSGYSHNGIVNNGLIDVHSDNVRELGRATFQEDITSKKIEEIFGKEEEEEAAAPPPRRMPKKPKYRSLLSIYEATRLKKVRKSKC